MARTWGLLLIAVGAAVGFAPAALALDRPFWLFVVVLATAALFAVAASTRGGLQAGFGLRGLLVALGVSAFGPAITGLFVLLAHFVGWLAGLLLEWLWSLMAPPPDLSAGLPLWLSVAALFLFGLPMVGASIATLLAWLARPPSERAEAAARLWRERSRTLASLVIAAVLGVAGAGISLLAPPAWTYLVPVQLALLFLCTPAWQAVAIARQRARSESRVDGVRTLLETAGFEVERLPRQEGESTPLARRIDLVARRGEEVVAVEVKAGSDGRREIDWRAAPSLSLAASALAHERELPHETVRPLLVLVDAVAAAGLEESAREESVGLLAVSADELAGGGEETHRAVVAKLSNALAERVAAS